MQGLIAGLPLWKAADASSVGGCPGLGLAMLTAIRLGHPRGGPVRGPPSRRLLGAPALLALTGARWPRLLIVSQSPCGAAPYTRSAPLHPSSWHRDRLLFSGWPRDRGFCIYHKRSWDRVQPRRVVCARYNALVVRSDWQPEGPGPCTSLCVQPGARRATGRERSAGTQSIGLPEWGGHTTWSEACVSWLERA